MSHFNYNFSFGSFQIHLPFLNILNYISFLIISNSFSFLGHFKLNFLFGSFQIHLPFRVISNSLVLPGMLTNLFSFNWTKIYHQLNRWTDWKDRWKGGRADGRTDGRAEEQVKGQMEGWKGGRAIGRAVGRAVGRAKGWKDR